MKVVLKRWRKAVRKSCIRSARLRVLSLCCVFLVGFTFETKTGSPDKISSLAGPTRRSPVRIGAYYFDGWTGRSSWHITNSLVSDFPGRKPKWGWITSKPDIMDDQIMDAKKSGLSFFNFCWYYDRKSGYQNLDLNQALSLYLKSGKRNGLDFSLLVANHEGFEIGPGDWSTVSAEWVRLFKQDGYLRVNGKPLISFFSVWTLLSNFGSPENVKTALDQLRELCRTSGVGEISIAICGVPGKDMTAKAERCGFDFITGYNYHETGMKYAGDRQQIPIDSLIRNERKTWDMFSSDKVRYIPAVTLNWDPRPWGNAKNDYKNKPYYVGFSKESVFKSVTSCIRWIKANRDKGPDDPVIILYAWNEYGEGAWLTPGAGRDTLQLLKGIKRAIQTSQ